MTSNRERPHERRTSSHRVPALGSGDLESIAYHLSFVLFALVLLWRPLFAGEAFFWGTPLLQFVPWQQLAADMRRVGRLPLWNSLVGCGAPLAANYQTAAFYPLNALHLLMRAEVALSWTVAVHLALTGWGMYRWGRRKGLDRFPAFVGALALEGSGFLVARAALFPSIALTFPWLAIWLWRGEVLIQTTRWRDALWLGLVLGLGLLAGHAQTAFYGGLLLAAYLPLRTIQNARADSFNPKGGQHSAQVSGPPGAHYCSRLALQIPRLLASLLIGLGLAAVQLLPTAELLVHSQRSAGVGAELAMTYSYWPWRLITLAAPDFFGHPARGDYWGYATYWEDAAYIGVLPLLLAAWAVAAGIRSTNPEPTDHDDCQGPTSDPSHPASRVSPLIRCSVLFWASTALVTLVLALGKHTPVFPFLFETVPGLGLFQAPARWLALTTLALAALAALGAQSWLHRSGGQRGGELMMTLGGALLLSGVAAPMLVPEIPATFGAATARLGVRLVPAGALTLLLVRWPGRRACWTAAAGLFITVDLLAFGRPLVPTVDRALYRGITGSAAALHSEGGPLRVYWPTDPHHEDLDYDAQYRVKFSYLTFSDFGPADPAHWRALREAQLPNAGMLDRVPTANNFDPLLVGRHADLLEAAVDVPGLLPLMGVTHVVTDGDWPGTEPFHSGGPATFYRLPDPAGRAWIVPHARHVAAEDTLDALTDPTFNPRSEVVLEIEPPLPSAPQQSAGAGRILSLRDAPNAVTIRASLEVPGYLVLADTWYPGWEASVGDQPVELLRANHAFRAVPLEAGEQTVTMVYRPISVLAGRGISLICLGIVTIGLLCTLREISGHRRRG